MNCVLFVCVYNVGRSQMAAALYNKLVSDGSHADSAGVQVERPGETISERASYMPPAQNVIDVMLEEGVDISQSYRTQLERDRLASYDAVIVMAEPELIPEWLKNTKGYEYWKMEDPREKGYDATKLTRDMIKERVIKLIEKQRS